ncbi:MAG: hypothetical protein CBB87_06835 [Micavibrio sp. TMED27]|nr:MAG: hypothetical protein CBB87_06835 [Micavibrio sp. TMED27]|tara:strand:+ start:1958 stop:2386 length:429 start_codon:yes stop_codon:yes gene_type:complete
MAIHLIKLVVGVKTLEDFAEIQRREAFDYHGDLAVPCWTRFMPKRAQEVLDCGGSIYRVLNNKIQCRHKILGFEMVEIDGQKRCMIVQDARMIKTISKPRRPFQGWRYLEPGKAPEDRGVYSAGDEEIPADIEAGLKDAGLL